MAQTIIGRTIFGDSISVHALPDKPEPARADPAANRLTFDQAAREFFKSRADFDRVVERDDFPKARRVYHGDFGMTMLLLRDEVARWCDGVRALARGLK